jgi:Rab-GTPase-TBC domain
MSSASVPQVRLWQVGRLMSPKLAAHLEERGCLPVLYMSSWLLTVFASAFPLSFASRVMDVLLTDSYSEPMMKVRFPLRCEAVAGMVDRRMAMGLRACPLGCYTQLTEAAISSRHDRMGCPLPRLPSAS